MSRIGKQPIEVPSGVEVHIEGNKIRVKGPKGELERELSLAINVEMTDNEIKFVPKENTKKSGALWGLTRSLVANMVEGVSKGFEKKLVIEGVGYRAAAEGDGIALNMGFSHPVKLQAPSNVSFIVEQNIITISGPDKETVGQFAASIKRVKPVEPYKGKGIHYEGEKIRRKVGKRAAGEGSAGSA